MPSTPPSSSGSCKATASTPNGSRVTSATPASPTRREERYGAALAPALPLNAMLYRIAHRALNHFIPVNCFVIDDIEMNNLSE